MVSEPHLYPKAITKVDDIGMQLALKDCSGAEICIIIQLIPHGNAYTKCLWSQ